jgi:type IV secretion system protein VirB4
MIDLDQFNREYREAAPFHTVIGPSCFVHPNVLLTKSGDLVTLLRCHGREFECATPDELDQACRRLEAALRAFDERFRVLQYWLKSKGAEIRTGHSGHPIAEKIAADRDRYLRTNRGGLFSAEIYWAICYENAIPGTARPRGLSAVFQKVSMTRRLSSTEDELHRARDLLLARVHGFTEQMLDLVRFDVLDIREGVRFLRRLLNYDSGKSASIPESNLSVLDFHLCNSSLECHSDHLKLGDDVIRVLTVKEPPSQTFPNLLSHLQEIPANLIAVIEWKAESAWNMRKLIKNAQRHHFISRTSLTSYATGGSTNSADRLVDTSSEAHVADLGESLKAIEVDGKRFGYWSMTVIVHARDLPALGRAVSSCSKVFSTAGIQVHEERYNLLNAWLAAIPGNHAFNRRRLFLLDTNCADLAFVFAPDIGTIENPHLKAEHLAILETPQLTPYFVNLHYQDVGHTFVAGATGAGKSFFVNFLIAMHQKYWPLTFIFDIGGSYKKLTEIFNGTYVRVGLDSRSFTINPFSLPKTKENLQFLFSFVKVLIISSGYDPSMDEDQDLWSQIESIYDLDATHRRLSTLASVLRRPLAQALTKWVGDGQYGMLFDNTEDNLTFASFQAFDFEGMDNFPEILEPLLFYVLHRASEAINRPDLSGKLKLFAMDEAWRFFRNPTIKAYIVQALKTWRKRNALMILATQSSDDLLRSEMLDVVVESCPTKFFLANPGIDRNAYGRLFHLSETETERIAGLIPKKQMLLHRPDVSKVLELNVDSETYALLASHSPTQPGDNF